MAKARKHRDAELDRLRGDIQGAMQLEVEDGRIPRPASSGPFSPGKNSDYLFQEHWRKLIAIPEGVGSETLTHGMPATATTTPSIVVDAVNTTQQGLVSYGEELSWSNSNFKSPYLTNQDLSNTDVTLNSTTAIDSYGEVQLGLTHDSSYNALATLPLDWSNSAGAIPWLWADADPLVDVFADIDVNMDLDTDIDWYNWVESANRMEREPGAS